MPYWSGEQAEWLEELKRRNPNSLGIVICEHETELAELPVSVRGVLREHLRVAELERL